MPQRPGVLQLPAALSYDRLVTEMGNRMQVEIFRGVGRVFAVIASGSGKALPERYGPWTAFKSLELARGRPQPGLHVDECLDDIEKYGIHVTDAHVRITEQALS